MDQGLIWITCPIIRLFPRPMPERRDKKIGTTLAGFSAGAQTGTLPASVAGETGEAVVRVTATERNNPQNSHKDLNP